MQQTQQSIVIEAAEIEIAERGSRERRQRENRQREREYSLGVGGGEESSVRASEPHRDTEPGVGGGWGIGERE